jgi:hypothetical protein
MDRPTLADVFMRAVAVAIADALIRLAHDNSEWGAWAGHAGFTSGLLQHDGVRSLKAVRVAGRNFSARLKLPRFLTHLVQWPI